MQVFPYDVWVSVLSLLSPLDIAAFERTCKNAWLIFQERIIWLAVLNNMSIDYTPNFSYYRPAVSLSALELRRTAERAQRTSMMWTYGNVIRPSHEAVVPIPQLALRPTFVKSTAGTPFVVAYSCEVGLMCINTESGSCVWTGTHELFSLHHFKTEVCIATGMQSTENLLICICTSNEYYRIACTKIMQVNVFSGTSRMLFSHSVGYDKPYWRFFAVRMSREVAVAIGFSLLLVVDWISGRVLEIDVKNKVLEVQVSDASIFILWINENKQAYLSVVPTRSLWARHDTQSLIVLWDIEAILLFPINSEIPMETGVRMSLYRKDALDDAIDLEATLTIVSCGRSDGISQLNFQVWRISIREVSEGPYSPIVVSQDSRRGHFLTNSALQHTSIDVSGLTRSGRFVVMIRDSQRFRHFFGCSYARIASGDLRLTPLEIPYDGDQMSVDRLTVDEYSGDVLWIYFCYTGIIITRF